MKTRTQPEIGQVFGRVMFVMIWAALVAGTAWGQQGSCVVSQIQLSIGTGGIEEVMTGNLDIEVHLANGFQKAQVTGGVWLDNTTNTVAIPLNQAIEVSDIKSIKMTYTSAPGFEQWLMSSFNATASGKGVIANIATSGPYQFNWTTTVFEINTVAAPCRPGITRVEGPVYVAPGTPAESPQQLTNEGIVQMVRQGEPEANILAAIRANSGKFDVSLDKMLALHRQGVSTHVLNAMVIAGTRERKAGGEKNADDLNPQPYPPKGTLLNSGAQHTLLGAQANSATADGSKSALIIAVQPPALADGSISNGSVRTSASGVPASQTSAVNGGGNAAITDGTMLTRDTQQTGTGQVPTKGSGKKGYDAVTVERGVTQDSSFANWANSPAPNSNGKAAVTASQTAVASAMAPKTSQGQIATSQTTSASSPLSKEGSGILLVGGNTNPGGSSLSKEGSGTLLLGGDTNPGGSEVTVAAVRGPSQVNLQVAAECAKDPSLRILGVSGSGQPITFTAGHQYVIWGCSFGPDNPDNAVYLSDGGSFVWFLEKVSWNANSVAVSVPNATPVSNLMLFVLGQNGNTKLNGVSLNN